MKTAKEISTVEKVEQLVRNLNLITVKQGLELAEVLIEKTDGWWKQRLPKLIDSQIEVWLKNNNRDLLSLEEVLLLWRDYGSPVRQGSSNHSFAKYLIAIHLKSETVYQRNQYWKEIQRAAEKFQDSIESTFFWLKKSPQHAEVTNELKRVRMKTQETTYNYLAEIYLNRLVLK